MLKIDIFISKKILTIYKMIKTIKVSDKGQISIPHSIRERIGIEKGDNLILFEMDGKILIQKQKEVSEKMRDDFKDILKFSEQSLKDVWGNKEDNVWSTYLKNGS